MYEWQTHFPSVATLIAENRRLFGMEAVYLLPTVLVLVASALKVAARTDDRPLRQFLQRLSFGRKGADIHHHPVLSALKTCPKCAGQLPLSTLVCDGCEYNFLSGGVGSRHKMLPAPTAAVNG